MAKRTVTTVSEGPALHKMNFAGAKMAEFGRVDKEAGWVTFHCSLGNADSAGFKGLFNKMGWTPPGEKTSMEKLDGKLAGGNFTLTSKDKLVDAEVNLDFKTLTGFAIHRFELEGRKGKGFRRELRFKISFEDEVGCANLEAYMMRTDNARGSLSVSYYQEAVQTEIETEDQLTLTTPEMRQAAMEA